MHRLPPDTPPDIKDFFEYWLSLPKADLLPSVSDYLDHAPLKLQPFVGIVDVLSSTESRVRYYGTGLSKITGSDPTGGAVNALFTDRLRALSAATLWQAVSHPVGYLCIRDTRSKSGITIHSPSICLPMRNPSQSAKLVVNFSQMPAVDFDNEPSREARLVTGWRLTHWIDIGAGVPA